MKRIRVLCLLIAMGIVLGQAAVGDDYPDCNWKCTANDVNVVGAYVEAPDACSPGELLTAEVYVTFVNGTNTDRYAVRVIGDLYVDGIYERSIDACVADRMEPGSTTVLLTTVSWTCGETLDFRILTVSWSPSRETCGDIPSCAARSAKCWTAPDVPVTGTPLAVAFSSTGFACAGESIGFTDLTAGGTRPYSYAWGFGDGSTSASANPSHSYANAGTYVVELTVTDSRGASGSAIDFVTVEAAPIAIASNGGPYCAGDTIELLASGGDFYDWTGPNGFSSSLQDPTIPLATAFDAGVYSVIVSNTYGCVDQASTLVEIDTEAPAVAVPSDRTVECGDSTDPSITGWATATDDADPSPSVSFSDVFEPSCVSAGTIERTWAAVDECGNTASAVQRITIADTTAPVLSVSSAEFECDGAGNSSDIDAWLESASATDACGDVTVTHNYAGLADACSGTGTASVTFTATDACGNAATRTVEVSVVDRTPPVATADEATTEEDVAVAIDVVTNDGDSCDPALALTDVGTSNFGTAVIVGEDVLYTPPAGFDGTATFSYTIEDCSGNAASTTVEVTVIPGNDAPVANDQSVTAAEETPVAIALTASDPDGDLLTYSILSGPSNGTISGFDSTTGELTYTPGAGYDGPDAFTFEACDPSGACDTGDVTIAVEGIDHPPVADSQSLTTPEDSPLPIALTGSDADGDPLTFGLVSGPNHGTIIDFDPLTGELLYVSDEEFSGIDTFVFETCDPHPEHGCAHATVTITVTPVNDPPLARDQARTTSEDTQTGFFALLISDPDHTLAEIECDCFAPPSYGTVERGPNHTVNYTPNSNFSGTDTFRYVVCDPDGLCDTATVTVNVAAVDDPPAASNDSAYVAEDGSVTIDVLGNDSDPDGDLDPTSVRVIGQPSSGTVSVDPVTGEITYEPDPNFNGQDSFSYEICDARGACDTATVTVNVTSVNDPPAAGDDTAQAVEDGSVTIDVADNDRDVDGDLDPMSVAIVSPPSSGTVSVDPATGEITYEPDPDFNGRDTFTYEICDGEGACDTATVTVDVLPVDDPPVANDDSTSTPEDTVVVVDVVANDYDVDGNLDPKTVQITVPPSNGTVDVDPLTGIVTYSPAEDFFGTDAFWYQVCDEDLLCSSARVTVSVGPIDDPPVALDDAGAVPEGGSITVDVLANDFDSDGNLDPASVTVVAPPSRGTYAVDPSTGAITYTPGGSGGGQDTLTYQVCDTDGECDLAVVTFAVTPVNDPPVALDDVAQVPEDGSVTIDVLGNDSDPDGDLRPTSVRVSDRPANGTVAINPSTGEITYIPNSNFNGRDSFRYTVCDERGACDTATVTMTVTAVNDPPTAQDDRAQVAEDGSVDIDVTRNDTDPDGDLDVTTVSIVSPPSNGTVTVDSTTGTIIFRPSPNANGPDAFTYQVCDREGVCDAARVTVDVIGVNDPPVAACLSSLSVDEGRTLIQLRATDRDGDPLTYRIVEGPEHGVVAEFDAAAGTFAYDSSGHVGPDAIVYEVIDSAGASDRCLVQLFVRAIAGAGGAAGCTRRVVISEVAWSGTDADPGHEWIELRNLEDEPVDLSGWTLRWRRSLPETREERLWKVVALSGVIAAREPDAGIEFRQAEERPGTWWVLWGQEWRDDFFLLERETDAPVLHITADLVYDDELPLDRLADFDDLGDVIELVDAAGCVVDLANTTDSGGWVAGGLWPTATMERTDPLDLDLEEDWHTNLGLVRTEMDAWGQLIHGTPKHENSPILAEAVAAAIEPSSVPMGEAIVLRFEPLPEWPVDERLWRVLVTRPPNDEVHEAEWTIGASEAGDILVEIATNRLPLDVEFHVWVRTPSGDVLFAPFLLYPY